MADRYTPLSASELASGEDEVISWLPMLGQDGFFMEGRTHVLSSAPHCGKTELLTTCAHEWARTGRRVFVLSEEAPPIWRFRLKKHGRDWDGLTILPALGMPIPAMLSIAFESDADVVILDTIRGLLALEEENSNSQMVAALSPWAQASQITGKTFVANHHDRKGGGAHGEGVAGGSGLIGSVDVVIQLSRPAGANGSDEADNRRQLATTPRLVAPRKALIHFGDDGILHYDGETGAIRQRAVNEAVRDVLAEDPGRWFRTAEVVEATGLPKHNALAALNFLARNDGQARRDPPIEIEAGRKTIRWQHSPALTLVQ